MIEHSQSFCPICKKPFAKLSENVTHNRGNSLKAPLHCPNCETPFRGLWCFSWREDPLEKLVEEYKYQSVRAMSNILVELYDFILPKELQDIIIVPLPTIGRHIRERGFDHTLVLAKKLARRRKCQYQTLLTRKTDTVQVGAKIAERKSQASKTYALSSKINPSKTYLLLDDVWTTGSTMHSAAKILQNAGAQNIYGVVLAVSKPATNT